MGSAERTDAIVARLRELGEVTVADLAERTGHSEMTIRRDLERLAGQGILRRVRGGAVSLLPRGQEPPFAVRERQATEAKRRIAKAASELVGDGQAVVIDCGTTTVQVAHLLAGRPLAVMPLSLQVANVFAGGGETRLLLAGGEVRPGELSFVGPLAEASLAAVRFDTAILSCCGLSVPDGITAHDLGDVAIKRAAMRSAQRVILVADATKLGRVAMGYVAPADRVDTLVTDTSAPDDAVATLQSSGVAVVRA